MKGWIKLHRSLMTKDWFKNPKVSHFWVYCLLKATHKPVTVTVGFQQVRLHAGQFVFGRKKAAEKTGLSEREIRTCLEFLKKAGSLTIKPTNKFSIITIVNWHIYQDTRVETDQQNDHQATSNRPHTRNITAKHENKYFNSTPSSQVGGFISFWDREFQKKFGVPYRGPRGRDRRLIKKLLKVYSIERLQELANTFFDSHDSFIQKSNYSIQIFFSQIKKLLKGGLNGEFLLV